MSQTILAGAIAILAAVLPRARWGRPSLPVVVALAAIFYPVADALIDFVAIAPLVGQPTTLRALTPEQLSRMPWNMVENNLLVPLLGLAATAALGARRAARAFLAPLTRGWRDWSPEIVIGVAAIPIIVGAEALALAALQGPASFLQTADESALFANATIVHVVLLSLTPAIVEELYYRNLLQGALEEVWAGARGAWAALVLQAILFSLAHASYTSLAHMLGPLVFGLGMGALRTVGGLGSCMLAHASVNLFYFALDPGAGSLGLLAVVALASLAGLAMLAAAWHTIAGRLRAGPRPVLGSQRAHL